MEGERSRNKERIEISLAWLCELEALKQRQESLVLGALALGDTVPGYPAWGDVGPARSSREQEHLTLRRQLNRLQGAPSLLILALQQQLGEMRVNTGLTCMQNPEEDAESPSASSSGFYDQNECLSPPLRTCSSPNLAVSCHRPRSVDAYTLDWEGHLEPTIQARLPRSFSAPYPSLEGIVEGAEEEEEDEEGTEWAMTQMLEGGSLAEEDESLTPEMSLIADTEGNHTVKIDDGPTAEDIQQAIRVETYILSLLQRCHPRSSPELSSDHSLWQHIDPYSPSYSDLPHNQTEWQKWAALSEEESQEEAQEGYYINLPNDQAGPTSLGSEEPESSLEMDQYGVSEVSSSNDEVDSPQHQQSYHEHHPTKLNTMKPHVHTCCNQTCSAMSSTSDSLSSQEWDFLCFLTRRGSGERWTSGVNTHTNTTSSSQSDDDSFCQEWAIPGEHKYNTVGREIGRDPSDKFYTSNQRLQSADLNQEENENHFREEVQEIRRNHLSGHTFKHTCVQLMEQDQRGGKGLEKFMEQDQRVGKGLEKFMEQDQRVGKGLEKFMEQDQRVGKRLETTIEPTDCSDSSLSETFSPGTSSVSSDSDESGGLVWPQQLPPRLPPSSSSSQNSPNAVVKIKASHALKKKIMCFRSGSFKLMTTV